MYNPPPPPEQLDVLTKNHQNLTLLFPLAVIMLSFSEAELFLAKDRKKHHKRRILNHLLRMIGGT